MSSKILKVVVTGASSEIGLTICYLLAKGDVYGLTQMMDLVLVENRSRMKQLRGALSELGMSDLRLVRNFVSTDNLHQAFTDADVIILSGGLYAAPGYTRNDVIGVNALEFKEVGLVLSKVAKDSVKILMVVEPQNINLMVLSYFAPSIKPANLTGLSRVDHNRAQSMIARMLNISVDKVSHLTMWGNRSLKIFPDIRHAVVEVCGRVLPAYEAIKDDFFLKYKFTELLQNREADIIKKRKTTYCSMTVATAAVQHLRDWTLGTKKDDWTSMIVLSDGSYGIDKGLAYSFPVQVTSQGEWEIVQGLDINYYEREKLDERVNEIRVERMFAYSILELPEAKQEVEKDDECAVDQARATKWSFGHADPIPCSILGPLEQDRLGSL
ncbi:malate dehydrogenase, cytoplasmic-like [Physella acuta]|uniref:malate dehydrogenase, cytoplasmic-like n=1 Tax=Physella acuta TaxID=109671 RepID=UPI0027DAD1FC|nr:malate dehydrogenase, cytoplasmic-like [Physella acuta]